MVPDFQRRRVLRAVAAGSVATLSGIAGCSGGGDSDTGGSNFQQTSGDPGTGPTTPTDSGPKQVRCETLAPTAYERYDPGATPLVVGFERPASWSLSTDDDDGEFRVRIAGEVAITGGTTDSATARVEVQQSTDPLTESERDERLDLYGAEESPEEATTTVTVGGEDVLVLFEEGERLRAARCWIPHDVGGSTRYFETSVTPVVASTMMFERTKTYTTNGQKRVRTVRGAACTETLNAVVEHLVSTVESNPEATVEA